jgi:hypothetical protein
MISSDLRSRAQIKPNEASKNLQKNSFLTSKRFEIPTLHV